MDEERIQELCRDMPVFGRVEAIYKGTTAICEAGRSIANVLTTITNKNEFEEATAAIYLRMFFWIDSLTRLNKLPDTQAACSATRSMYELLIDLLEIKKDPKLVEQFANFNFVEKFRAAEKLVTAMDEAGNTTEHKPQRVFFDDTANKQKVDMLMAKHWPNLKKAPGNWRALDLAKRTEDLGAKEKVRYRTLYPMFSWYSHSGVVGFYDLSEDAYLSAFGMAQLYAQQIFQEASLLIGDQFQVFAVPELRQRIEEYSNATLREMANYVATKMNKEQ